jgi:hypothetical protein
MYAVIRRYRFDPADAAEINRRIKDIFVHLLRRTPGFEAYYWLDTAEGEGASISVFRDRAGAEQSTHIAGHFVHEHLATLLGTPELIQGEVHARADTHW